MEIPPPKYYRLFPGNSVRLRYGYIVTCTAGFTKDPMTGEVTEVRCSYDPATKGGDAPDNRKGQRHHPLGFRRPRPCRLRSASTTTSSPRKSRWTGGSGRRLGYYRQCRFS